MPTTSFHYPLPFLFFLASPFQCPQLPWATGILHLAFSCLSQPGFPYLTSGCCYVHARPGHLSRITSSEDNEKAASQGDMTRWNRQHNKDESLDGVVAHATNQVAFVFKGKQNKGSEWPLLVIVIFVFQMTLLPFTCTSPQNSQDPILYMPKK